MKLKVFALLLQAWQGVQIFFFPDHYTDRLPHPGELKLALVFMGGFWLVREYFLGKLMVQGMGRCLGIMIDTLALKVINQSLNLAMHIFSTAWGLWYLPQCPWFHDFLSGNDGVLYDHIAQGEPLDLPLKVFYNVHLGYQLHALQFTVMEGRKLPIDRREDYRYMLAHHVVASTLIFVSYIMGYTRIGVVTMLLHNASDILACLTKGTRLLGWSRMSVILLPMMMAVWFITRLVLFPRYVLCTLRVSTVVTLPTAHSILLSFCICGLFAIMGLNIYWFATFVHIAFNVVWFGHADDITESTITNQASSKYGLWGKGNRWWCGRGYVAE